MSTRLTVLCLVRALHDYSAADDAQLSFCAGDVFPITAMEASGWWEGVVNERIGWLPSTFVECLASAAVQQAMTQVPKSVRIRPEKAAELLASLVAQEQQQQQSHSPAKPDRRRPSFFRKRTDAVKPRDKGGATSPLGGSRDRVVPGGATSPRDKVVPGAASPPAPVSPRKLALFQKRKELSISAPVSFEHRGHLTAEEAMSEAALVEKAPQLGVTQTSAKRVAQQHGARSPPPVFHPTAGLKEHEEPAPGFVREIIGTPPKFPALPPGLLEEGFTGEFSVDDSPRRAGFDGPVTVDIVKHKDAVSAFGLPLSTMKLSPRRSEPDLRSVVAAPVPPPRPPRSDIPAEDEGPSQLEQLKTLVLSGDVVLPEEVLDADVLVLNGSGGGGGDDEEVDELEELANLAKGLDVGLGMLEVEGGSTLLPHTPLPQLPTSAQ